jgi:hypothetical protein
MKTEKSKRFNNPIACPACERYGDIVEFSTVEELAAHVQTHPLGPDLDPMAYKLAKYEPAFALLGQAENWRTQVPEFTRQAMVFVALNLDYGKWDYRDNANQQALQNLFGSTSGLKWDDRAIKNCLDEIHRLGHTRKSRKSAGR